MAFAAALRQRREKQVNVRLNDDEAIDFARIMKKMEHQTVSDSIRDMIRSSFMDFSLKSQLEIDRIMRHVPADTDEVKKHQVNVRLNPRELEMTTHLIKWMKCDSTSAAIRNLINIYSQSIEEQPLAKAK